ncbi:MAG: hypothetical protein QOG63_2229 [Thermoleophilaceae bacterium]|nr:hypothetical protein [Thermoleophilaceae bacterium]
MAGPDFVGVGTLDAGAAWWHRALRAHPRVDSRRWRKRSLHFFDEFCIRPMTDADVAAYQSQFPRRGGRVTGEWTTRYAHDVWTPPLIARAAPEAKLILLVSDPIERYRRRLARWHAGGSDYEPVHSLTDVTSRGHYATQLRRLTEHFPLDRVLVLQQEKCRADPLGEYARTLRFLGIRDGYVPRRLRWQAARAAGEDKPYIRLLRRSGVPLAKVKPLVRRLRRRPELSPVELWPDLEESLHHEFDGEVRALAELVPELDLSLWPNFAALARDRSPVAA